ncbi:monocarboxylate transporter 9-like isoform X1 [Onthophagus taurus]|uniref:monocarboxylate transporter 9-like isoform X1 n=1 Tax=Onthophagus taurus TaxID=166361 RepID=UPI0039BDF903
MDKTLKVPEIKIDHCNQPKRRRYRVTDPDFIAPDGGWGWLILLACGFSNLSTFPMLQQFGLIFREKFQRLDFTNPETTTIINLNSAATACIGLLNGPVFRKYSYRQYAFFGSILISISLVLTCFANTVWMYLLLYSIIYGAGLGITQSSNALALNTYFRRKRRIATGLSWTTTAVGPIVCPYIINYLMGLYGMEGTLGIFAGFSMHAIACALLLQPVHWHTTFREEGQKLTEGESGFFDGKHKKSKSLLSSQYFDNDDERFSCGFDMVDPGTPMLIYANDGWYSRKSSLRGSRMSLASSRGRSRLASGQTSVAMSKKSSYTNLTEIKKKKPGGPIIQEHDAEDCPTEKAPQDLKEEEKKLLLNENVEKSKNGKNDLYPNEKVVLKTAAQKLERYKEFKDIQAKERQRKEDLRKLKEVQEQTSKEEGDEKNYTFLQKLSMFFDLNLFKDYVYVNLMLGITIANFVELNFSILTPFVLKEFHFENYQIATFMSLLGASDIVVRFIVPLLADRIGWENKSFFLFGVLCMAFGRIILVHTQTYQWSILVAVIIGFGKGLRTVFMALVIPSHVPLEKLPAASGLQLATSGLLFLVMGPVIGWIRDSVNNYVVTLHLLNILTYATAVAWLGEKFLRNIRK